MEILPRGISDHAPLLLKLQTDSLAGPALWRLSGLWVFDKRVTLLVEGELGVYWVNNGGTPPRCSGTPLRHTHEGNTKQLLGSLEKETRIALEEAERKVQLLEDRYMTSKDALT